MITVTLLSETERWKRSLLRRGMVISGCSSGEKPHSPTETFTYKQLFKVGHWKKSAIGCSNGLGHPIAQLVMTTYLHPDSDHLPEPQNLFSLMIRLRNRLMSVSDASDPFPREIDSGMLRGLSLSQRWRIHDRSPGHLLPGRARRQALLSSGSSVKPQEGWIFKAAAGSSYPRKTEKRWTSNPRVASARS